MSEHPYGHVFPAPPIPDLGPPAVEASYGGHIVILLYPWADDDADLVTTRFGELLPVLQQLHADMVRAGDKFHGRNPGVADASPGQEVTDPAPDA